ncbi:oligosaccharide flippase family protein, partial [Patescibacteria group bacterium]|nr:oligosaccharide flippase family protein [Patescibacteria group bacterium]
RNLLINISMLTNIKSFLFKNKSFKQTIAKNSFRLLIAEFVSRLFTFLISLRVARALGVVEFGAYNFVMTYVIFFVLIVDF